MFSIDQNGRNPCLARYAANGQRMLLPGGETFQAGRDHRLPCLETAVNPASTLRHFHCTSGRDHSHVHAVSGVPWGPTQHTPPLHAAVYGYCSKDEYHNPLPQYYHATNNLGFAQYPGATPSQLYGLYQDPKPTQSYIGLIAIAILSVPENKLVLSDIYQYIMDHYPYFHARGPGWRNSIRHNLSLNDCFIKSGRSINGKGHFWAIHPANVDDFKKGDFRRRRAQRKVRKYLGMKNRCEEKSEKDTFAISVDDCSMGNMPPNDDCSINADDHDDEVDIIVDVDDDRSYVDEEVDEISTEETIISSQVENNQRCQTSIATDSLKRDEPDSETTKDVIQMKNEPTIGKRKQPLKRRGPFDMDTILSSHFPCAWKMAQADNSHQFGNVCALPPKLQDIPKYSVYQTSAVLPSTSLYSAFSEGQLPMSQHCPASVVNQESSVLPESSVVRVPHQLSAVSPAIQPVPLLQEHRLTVASERKEIQQH